MKTKTSVSSTKKPTVALKDLKSKKNPKGGVAVIGGVATAASVAGISATGTISGTAPRK